MTIKEQEKRLLIIVSIDCELLALVCSLVGCTWKFSSFLVMTGCTCAIVRVDKLHQRVHAAQRLIRLMVCLVSVVRKLHGQVVQSSRVVQERGVRGRQERARLYLNVVCFAWVLEVAVPVIRRRLIAETPEHT
jgi:hypothetical protein